MKLLMLKGLPGSGKSTWAKNFTAGNPNWIRINKDSIREMIGGYRRSDEWLILEFRDALILTALDGGNNVIVDDTNLHPKHELRLREIATKHSLEFEIKFFDTPLKQCIANDLKRPVSVGEKVIKQMWREFLAPQKKVQNWTVGLPPAIIVDIDGTIAMHVARGPYDMEQCNTDKPNKVIQAIVRGFYEQNYRVIFVSGREEKYRQMTEDWFKTELNVDSYAYKLFMRPTDDRREDSIIKQEIYDREILGKYNIFLVLDDRNRVIDMWRRNGLIALQVADGDF